MEPLSAKSILPPSVLEPLINDYFTFIHPLTPIPHEPSFRAALGRHEDRTDSSFLALLASMIGCLVSAFPQRLQSVVQMHDIGNLSARVLVEHCRAVTNEARGTAFLDSDFAIQDAMTSLLLGLTGVYMYDWKMCRIHLSQCQTISRIIGLHKATWPKCSSAVYSRPGMSTNRRINCESSEAQVNLVLQELGRRTFWGLFMAIKSLQQIRVCFSDLSFSPETAAEPYPPLPLEFDDECLTPAATILPSHGTLSELVEFNLNIKILSSYDQLVGTSHYYSSEDQMMLLQHSFLMITGVRRGIPNELGGTCATSPGPQGEVLRSLPSHPSTLSGYDFKESTAERARIEEAQKIAAERTKIRTSMQISDLETNQLSVYAYFVSRYWSICDTRAHIHPGNREAVNPSLRSTEDSSHGFAPASVSVLDHQLIIDYTATIVSGFILHLSAINKGELEINHRKYASHT